MCVCVRERERERNFKREIFSYQTSLIVIANTPNDPHKFKVNFTTHQKPLRAVDVVQEKKREISEIMQNNTKRNDNSYELFKRC